jgi:hypothetical protein
MKTNRQAQQLIEYLILFAGVILVVFASAKGVGKATQGILGSSLEGLRESTYTYTWVTADCGSCSRDCMDTVNDLTGTQTCGVKCQRNDGTDVGDDLCPQPKPGDVTQDCNTQPCPIDCKLATTWTTGTCYPVCGTNRERVDTREVITPAQYGGQPCTDPTSQVVSCDPLPCPGKCGNGAIELGEECDLHNFGEYGEGSCDNLKLEMRFGQDFVAGRMTCNPPNPNDPDDPNQCQINLSECRFDRCNGWEAGQCSVDEEDHNCSPLVETCSTQDGDFWTAPPATANCHTDKKCNDGYKSYSNGCTRYKDFSRTGNTAAETQLCTYTLVECRADNNCRFQCATSIDNQASYCTGANERLSVNDDKKVYYKDSGECPYFDPGASRDAIISDLACSAACLPPTTRAQNDPDIPGCFCEDGRLVLTGTSCLCCCPPSEGPNTIVEDATHYTTTTTKYNCQTCDSVICGDGIVESDEQCDGDSNLGIHPNRCIFFNANYVELTTDSGEDITTTYVTCRDDCKLDLSQCLYEACTETNRGCGANVPCTPENGVGDPTLCLPEPDGKCPDGYRGYSKTCETKTVVEQTIIATDTHVFCRKDSTCEFSCTGSTANAATCFSLKDIDDQSRLTGDTLYIPISNSSNCTPAIKCQMKCNQHYTPSGSTRGSTCQADTQQASCTGTLPNNTVWNDGDTPDGKFIQTWNGIEFSPATKDISYNTSVGECHYKCQPDYELKDSSCQVKTQLAACSGGSTAPTNAEWNDATDPGYFTQIMSGGSWTPLTKSISYNETTPGDCVYKCLNALWDVDACKTSRLTSCLSLPNTTYYQWNDTSDPGKFTQTVTNGAWTPTPAGKGISHNETTGGDCVYKCLNALWDVDACKTSRLTPCPRLPTNAYWNDTSDSGKFTQTVSSGNWTPANMDILYNETPGDCHFLCNSNFHSDGFTACVPN